MVYDRRYENGELNFEASGALLEASLVMRDRETDSWWSIMTSTAIGGPMDGSELIEMPVGQKTRWRDWVAVHPKTLVLSIDGVEHLDDNPYEGYFEGTGTFRNIEVADRRMPAKEPIFGAWVDGQPFAIAHASFAGGELFALPDGRRMLLDRAPGAALFLSSRAFLIAAPTEGTPTELLAAIATGGLEAEPVSGFDTFWYNWILINAESIVLE